MNAKNQRTPVERIIKIRPLVGAFAGQVFNAQWIGYQEFPNQIQQRKLLPDFNNWITKQYTLGEAVWLHGPNIALRRANPRNVSTAGYYLKIDETAVYDGLFEDLGLAMDRNNRELFLGDGVYVVSKGRVCFGEVVKIGARPYQSHGRYDITRKITVRDHTENTTIVVNDSRTTFKP